MTEPDCPVPGQQGSAVLTVALTALRTGFNIAFPDRDKGSDGWIGDTAHQQNTSGHNPDDTSGVSAEYSDSDSKAEVRAIDVDKDFKSSAGVSMQDVIDRILATPNDTRRLKYIIFNRTQWSKSNDWRPTNYTGSNPHDKHGHFSGDPGYDEDGSPWSVETMGDGDMSITPVEWNTGWMVQRLAEGANPIVIPPSTDSDNVNPPAPGATFPNAIAEANAALAAQLAALTVAVPPDLIARLDLILEAAQNDDQMSVVLPPDALVALEEILALLKTLPAATVDEFAERLQTPA